VLAQVLLASLKLNIEEFWRRSSASLTFSRYFLGYPKVIPYTKFEHFGVICFSVMLWIKTDKWTDSKILSTPTDIVGGDIKYS